MSNVRDIRSHPRFQPRLDPESPTYEADQYHRYLASGEVAQGDHVLTDDSYLEMLETREEIAQRTGLSKLSICHDCVYSQDPLYAQQSLRRRIWNWLRDRKPKMICTHGLVQYCQDKNPDGDCPAFKPTIYYR